MNKSVEPLTCDNCGKETPASKLYNYAPAEMKICNKCRLRFEAIERNKALKGTKKPKK